MSEPADATHDGKADQLRGCLLQAALLVGSAKEQVSTESTENQEGNSIEQLLSTRLARLDIDDQGDSLTIRARYVDQCLQLLVAIQTALVQEISNDAQGEKDYLGVRDLRLVHTLLQVVISWGLYPYFSPGVGVPLSKRVKSGYTNHELFGADDQASHHMNSQRSLLSNTTRLVDLMAHSYKALVGKRGTTVSSILLLRHLPDLYAALLQLAYEPAQASQIPNDTKTPPKVAAPLNPTSLFDASTQTANKTDETALTADEKAKCARMFMWLFDKSDPYRAMESLMLLLGTSPLHPAPAWLRAICGRFLSKLLLQPTGVATVLKFTIGSADHVQLIELEKVAKLVLSVPRQMNSVESYYAVIAPQLVDLLRNAQGTSQDQAVTFILGRMITKHPEISQKLIVEPLTGAFVDAWQRRDYDEGGAPSEILGGDVDRVVLDDAAMASLIRSMHTILVGGEPSPVVIHQVMGSCVAALYQLYEFTCRTKSGVRESVLDLLTTYFRLMTTEQCMDDLQHIILDPVDLFGDRVAYFCLSDSGGVQLKWKRTPKPLGGNELPLDVSRLVTFLSSLNNADLCGDLFVFLLNTYTNMQSAGSEPKSILMILQLIMSMADSLGPDILGKPIQILAFANNTVLGQLERMDRLQKPPAQASPSSSGSLFAELGNIVSDEQREMMDDMDDDTFTAEDELESLLLAINLIRAVIHENEDLDQEAIQSLSSLLPSLKRLEKISGEMLEDQVHEVILAITAVLSSRDMDRVADGGQLAESKKKYREAMKALQDELLPVRAHGIGILKEMVLAKDPLVSSGQALDDLLDLFIRLIQDDDSYIYMNAIKGLAALTDMHGNRIIEKLGRVYANDNEKMDHRLRVGEALMQTIQRCGDTLGKYIQALIKPLEKVLASRQVDVTLRTSALSILSSACQTCPTALSGMLWQLTDWVLNILDIEKQPEVRRAATVLILSLFRGMAAQTLYEFPTENLRRAYRTLRYVEHTDPDELTRYQARVALSDLDVLMRGEIFQK
ncbi:hypothetical protein BC940DRAFT_367058 [Gongronella butleri]|nr:hypothetical protein BC940DRAFT_367058 [Gongronella butleri]